jgi:hypothetical protein
MLNIIWRVTKITVIIEEIKHIQLVEQYLICRIACVPLQAFTNWFGPASLLDLAEV